MPEPSRQPASGRLQAYVSCALTGIPDRTRHEIDATVSVVRQACASSRVSFDIYVPGDHTDPKRDSHVSSEDVFDVDRKRVKEADVLLLLGHAPSIGVGQELNMAFESLLPVVFLVPAGRSLSRMARGVPLVSVEVPYGDDDELRWRLIEALAGLRPRLVARRSAVANLERVVVGARLKERRRQRGLSREQVAEATGLTVRGVALLEDATDRRADPSLTQLRTLAALLGTTAGELV